MIQAAQSIGRDISLTVINHWDIAIETHAANYPKARHLCESLDNVDPRKLFKDRIRLLVASPECTHHSNARGGVPCSDQSRATAWHIVRWASSLYIDNILIENVPEFVSWGPLGAKGQPIKEKKGATFLAFKGALESLGYRCEWRILNTANYGDATCRKRFFMLCRRGNKRIEWPEPTHTQAGGENLFGSTSPWVPARSVIDWAYPAQSIFDRRHPLSDNTLARIEAGLKRYGGEEFLVKLYGTGKTSGIGEPLPTVTANGQHLGICRPFLVNYHGNHKGKHDGESRVHDVTEPMATLDTSNRYALAMPFILPQQKGGPGETRTRSIDIPLSTITTTGAEAVAVPFITVNKGTSSARDIDDPLPCITTHSHLSLSFLVKYYGSGQGVADIKEPLDTVTTKARFGLVEAFRNTEGADILFRMLQPHELAAAHSFPRDYQFKGTKTDVIKQIGNSVPIRTAQALCATML